MKYLVLLLLSTSCVSVQRERYARYVDNQKRYAAERKALKDSIHNAKVFKN
jgi:hypothetical protein